MLIWKKNCNFFQSQQVVGENVQVLKDLKITMGNYVLHFEFHARDMDNMDIFLGYPWMK